MSATPPNETLDMMLNMGPQHPATHGVFRMVLTVDGERVVDVVPHIGYLHRGSERLSETESYLEVDYRISCLSSSYTDTFTPIGKVGVALFPLGIPVVTLLLLPIKVFPLQMWHQCQLLMQRLLLRLLAPLRHRCQVRIQGRKPCPPAQSPGLPLRRRC
mgnify:CR=1 FL=1